MLDLHPHLNCQSMVVRLRDVAQFMPKYDLRDQNPKK